MRSGHCWGSAGRRWLRRMTRCTAVHGNIQNAAAKTGRASSERGYRQIVTKSGALGRQPDKDVKIHQSASEPFEYTCYALPKTDDARRVHLPHGFGRTADEAREYIVEHYNYLKTPPHRPFRGKWIFRS